MGIFDIDYKVASIRIAGIYALMKLFSTTQQILGTHDPVTQIVDLSHVYTASWNAYILEHKELADGIMILSSLLVDLSVVYLGIVSFFSKVCMLVIIFKHKQPNLTTNLSSMQLNPATSTSPQLEPTIATTIISAQVFSFLWIYS